MSKVLDEASKNNDELNEVKNLCVHDLKQKLREKQKKQLIKRVMQNNSLISVWPRRDNYNWNTN